MALALGWIVMTYIVRREYVAAFRDSLLRHRVDSDALVINPSDPVVVTALADSLRSDRGVALNNTLRLVTGIQSPSLVDPLVALAHDRDAEVAIAALDRLKEQDDEASRSKVADLLDSDHVEVGARALRLLSGGDVVDPLKLGVYLADDRPRVRLAAVLCLVRWGGALNDSAGLDATTLEQFIADSGAEDDPHATQRLLVSLLRDLPAGPQAEKYIARFLESDDAKVQTEAMAAAGRLRSAALLPKLIDRLQDRSQRFVARAALVAYGDDAIPQLAARFADRTAPPRIRESIPRVLALIPSVQSAELLMSGLNDTNDRVRFAALRSLGRLRAKHPEMVPDAEAIALRLNDEIRKAYRYQEWVLSVAPSDETRLLVHTLQEKSSKTIDRIFRLLAMKHPPAELYAASKALASPNGRVRANAIEYLDNLLEGRDKKWVLGLIEEKPSLESVRRRLHEHDLHPHAWPELLRHQARNPDDWLAAIAVYTVWTAKQSALYELLNDPDVMDGDNKPIARETVTVLRTRVPK